MPKNSYNLLEYKHYLFTYKLRMIWFCHGEQKLMVMFMKHLVKNCVEVHDVLNIFELNPSFIPLISLLLSSPSTSSSFIHLFLQIIFFNQQIWSFFNKSFTLRSSLKYFLIHFLLARSGFISRILTKNSFNSEEFSGVIFSCSE